MLKNKNRVISIAIMFAAIYLVSYLTRINFGAVVAQMEQSTGISKKLLSLSLTGSFVTYGIGQVLSGAAVDRISPKKLITVGLAATAAMNFLLPLCSSPYSMMVVWCINGFAQSMMWPPIVKMMSQLFDEEQYKQAAVIVSWGSSVGTIGVYVLVPAVLSVLSWKWVFYICGSVAVITVVLWQLFAYKPAAAATQAKKETGSMGKLFTPLLLGVMGAIVLQGMLRDGVTTWMPSYIIEVYRWNTASSILSGVILPIFSIISFQAATRLYRKVFTNPLTCAGVFFALGLGCAAGLYFVTGGNAWVSVLLSALLTGAMHGVNMMLISMLPPYFKAMGLTGTASGLLNSCTYIGSALSTYGVAAVSQWAGWKNTVLIWTAIACLGTVLCFACVKPFRKTFLRR